jgi:serine/threonine protein kinase
VSSAQAPQSRIVGRYALCGEIASGGMGTVHIGRLLGPAGFSRTVAIKSLHPHLARDPEFVAMFLDEARLAARVVHPNVVPTIDVVATEAELFVVMEYVQGESLAKLLVASRARGVPVAPRIVSAIVSNVLHGLHAAHETRNELGEFLGIVHRDVTPHNVLVGVDGVARLLDFGVAKAADRIQTTRDGHIKGKLPYMPPEQLRGSAVNRQADVYAAGVVLWEALTGRRLFEAENEGALLERILFGTIAPPSTVAAGIPLALDAVAMRSLAQERAQRFATAREMVIALQDAVPPAAPNEVGEWVESLAEDALTDRRKRVAAVERMTAESSGSGSKLAFDLAAGSGSRPLVDDGKGVRPPGEGEMHSATQMSTVSMSVPPGDFARGGWRRRRVVALVGLVAVIGAAAVAYAALRSNRNAPTEGAAVSPAAASSAPAPLAVVSSIAPAEAPAQASATTPPPTPSTVADAGSRIAPGGRSPRLKPNCDPPYVVTPSGDRQYKRECL